MLSRHPIDLENKVAIVTGGGTGIGKAIAISLAHSGARVAVCGRRADRLDEVVSDMRAIGAAGIGITADVSLEEDVQRVIQKTIESFHQVDILVNNAGVSDGGLIHELAPEIWDRMMATNLRGPFLMTRSVLTGMRERRFGHIINISSESGLEYYAEDASYGSSKHALNAFGEYIQRENQDWNIRVNTICPGMVVTEMTEKEPGLVFERCLFPEDIAELVMFLLTRRPNIKIGTPILIQSMLNPWDSD
jgi:NAD(P)-dependent dehydrogenase (short-subunit alcohol dehydrogenase family)